MQAIQSSADAILRVSGFILFFSVLSAQLQQLIRSRSVIVTLALAALELAGGMSALEAAPFTAQGLWIACAALIGWGGLCVHGQVTSSLLRTDLRPRYFLLGKLGNMCLSTAMACLTLPLVSRAAPCFASGGGTVWQPYLVFLWMIVLVAGKLPLEKWCSFRYNKGKRRYVSCCFEKK